MLRLTNMQKDYTNSQPITVLKEVFGYKEFRLSQENIILNVLAKKDTLAVMPTGGGKSLCYQIPALIFDGITVVVSPLISLMQDQVETLITNGVDAVFLNSTLEWNNYLDAMNSIRHGKTKLVYVSPEGLNSSKITELLHDQNVKVSCITIDEAHCVSQWGHDFRPDYLEISSIRKQFPNAVCLALTATATKQVQNDIIKNLALKNPEILISSFNRPNIFLNVQHKKNAIYQVVECIKRHNDESGIIYCFSRKQVDSLTQTLQELGYSVLNYHAGLTDEVRRKNQTLFIHDDIQIMVATLAFGMGIDKPNVRFVIHYDLPRSLEQYYQEIGRAGRDGLPCEALLLYNNGDIYKIKHFFTDASDPQNSEELLQQMIQYATTNNCRRKTLLKYFGENFSGQNTCCDICDSDPKEIIDMTIQCQKLMSCIIRTKSRFGATYIINVLLGSREKRIIENGHNFISTWAIGTELTKYEWQSIVNLLIEQKYITKSEEYSVLMLTNKGLNALKNRDKIMIPFVKTDFAASDVNLKSSSTFMAKNKSFAKPFVLHKSSVEHFDTTNTENLTVLKALKQLRKQIAEGLKLPAYMIFSDKALLDIAQKKPKSNEELLECYGIGEAKVLKFGKQIIETLKGV